MMITFIDLLGDKHSTIRPELIDQEEPQNEERSSR
jgi:hypothetical protein